MVFQDCYIMLLYDKYWEYGRCLVAEDRWHEFSPVDGSKVEQAYEVWDKSGKPKEHEKCRVEITLETGMVLSLDFHLGTQITVGKKGRRRIRRYELPSKAQQSCQPFFESVLSVVGDISNKLEEVSGQMAGMDIDEAHVMELQERSRRCIELLRPSVTTFVELSLFCGANEQMEKLEAMLGEKHAASLGVSAGGRDMRMQTVLKAVKEAPLKSLFLLSKAIRELL